MGQQRPLVAAASECSPMPPMFSAVLSLPGLSYPWPSTPYTHNFPPFFFFLEWFRVCILEPRHRKPSPREETDSCLTECHTHSSDQGLPGDFFHFAACITCFLHFAPHLDSSPAHKSHSELYCVGDIHRHSFCSQMRGTTIVLRHKRGRVGCRHSWVSCLSCPRFLITPFSYSDLAFFGLWTCGSQIWSRYPHN